MGGSHDASHHPDDDADKRGQTKGREENAARPIGRFGDSVTPQAYPAVRADDAVEAEEIRSFDPRADAPTPRQGAGDTSPTALNEGRTGPQADPAEGKRD